MFKYYEDCFIALVCVVSAFVSAGLLWFITYAAVVEKLVTAQFLLGLILFMGIAPAVCSLIRTWREKADES